ncbi:MAG: GIY-YIG nuclease family protein, partial [Patescibacteria group bacterium]
SALRGFPLAVHVAPPKRYKHPLRFTGLPMRRITWHRQKYPHTWSALRGFPLAVHVAPPKRYNHGMNYVYVLESVQDRVWYIGFTSDLKRRIYEHSAGKNISTRRHGPYKLIYYEAYLNKADVLGREKFLKSGSGHRFLKKQLFFYFKENA